MIAWPTRWQVGADVGGDLRWRVRFRRVAGWLALAALLLACDGIAGLRS
jgi:hypothetical protein